MIETFIHQWDGICTWPKGECAICEGLISDEELALIKADDPKGWKALMETTLKLENTRATSV